MEEPAQAWFLRCVCTYDAPDAHHGIGYGPRALCGWLLDRRQATYNIGIGRADGLRGPLQRDQSATPG